MGGKYCDVLCLIKHFVLAVVIYKKESFVEENGVWKLSRMLQWKQIKVNPEGGGGVGGWQVT